MSLSKYQQKSNLSSTDRLIDNWLSDRQELLVLYSSVCKIEIFGERYSDNDVEELQNFITVLIDYVSSGHFEVFEKIAAASEKNTSFFGLKRELIEKILRTTIKALDFSDKYNHSTEVSMLNYDLSTLGETLATRMELEDQLIQCYLHASQSNQDVANF